MDLDEIAQLLARQCGVISRQQVLAARGTDADIERLVRRREWSRVHEGVFVDHTGRLDRDQKCWAAVLYAWPSALTGLDALRAHGLRVDEARPDEPVQVVIPAARRVAEQPGVRVNRSTSYERDVQDHLSPPRVRIEPAVLVVASAAEREDVAVSTISDACQSRRTTSRRLLVALGAMSRIRHRRLLQKILEDVSTGAFSALERRFLVTVERPHGLPTGVRQRRVRFGSRVYFRDVEYRELHTVVELDGRIGHTSRADRWADLERDLESARHGDVTVRVGWLQVLDPHRPCGCPRDAAGRPRMGWESAALRTRLRGA